MILIAYPNEGLTKLHNCRAPCTFNELKTSLSWWRVKTQVVKTKGVLIKKDLYLESFCINMYRPMN